MTNLITGGYAIFAAAAGRTTEYQPFYSFKHGRTRDNQQSFWYASRKPSLQEGDRVSMTPTKIEGAAHAA